MPTPAAITASTAPAIATMPMARTSVWRKSFSAFGRGSGSWFQLQAPSCQTIGWMIRARNSSIAVRRLWLIASSAR